MGSAHAGNRGARNRCADGRGVYAASVFRHARIRSRRADGTAAGIGIRSRIRRGRAAARTGGPGRFGCPGRQRLSPRQHQESARRWDSRRDRDSAGSRPHRPERGTRSAEHPLVPPVPPPAPPVLPAPDSAGSGGAAESARNSAAACLATTCPGRIASTALIRRQSRLATTAHQASHNKGCNARRHFTHLDLHVLNRPAICMPNCAPRSLGPIPSQRREDRCGAGSEF